MTNYIVYTDKDTPYKIELKATPLFLEVSCYAEGKVFRVQRIRWKDLEDTRTEATREVLQLLESHDPEFYDRCKKAEII